MSSPSPALASVRICDFGGVLAGAGATRILAAFGAQVIRIEDPSNQGRWDVLRGSPPYPGGIAGPERGGGFNNHNVEKLGITLNLKTERGKELFRALVRVSDVVAENFAAGVMARLGFGWEQLRALKPELVYVSNCGFGHSGPYQSFKSWGPIVQALSGLTFASGLPDQPPAGWGYSYMDHTGAYYMAIAILMGLYHRRRTGQGQWIDLAMTEAALTLNGPVLLDYTANGRPLRRPGMPHSNRSQSPRMAPRHLPRARRRSVDRDRLPRRRRLGTARTRDRSRVGAGAALDAARKPPCRRGRARCAARFVDPRARQVRAAAGAAGRRRARGRRPAPR
jgi:crotonobetainyl-CoA:carnitine CoA-transferase CaiB-like acyl-CoA transferase